MFANRIRVVCQMVVITIVLGFVPPAVRAHDLSTSTQRVLESGSELDYPPFALVRPDGSADGFSVDLLKAVTKAVGLEVNIPVGPWHEIRQNLVEGRLDVLPLVAHSQEREEMFDFTVPYLRMHGTIFVRKGDRSIRSEADLKDREVLVMRDDAAHEYAVRNNLSDKLVLTDSFEKAMKLLSEGKHDAVVVQQLVGLQLIKKLGISNLISIDGYSETGLKPSDRPLSGFEQKFCIAVKEGDKELLALLNEGLAITIANGTYEKLYDKWFSPILPPPYVPWTVKLRYLLFSLGPILLLLATMGLWYLKREVAMKTLSLTEEIKERKLAEEQIKVSLREKEVLLRELYHRTRNNMQVIRGLLTLQSDRIADERVLEIFRETENRIMSMALVHEKLFQSQDLSKIDLGHYIEDLIDALFKGYDVSVDKISLNLNMGSVYISVDLAVPCGLVINELITNVLKHAFPHDCLGEIRITLHSTDESGIELKIGDNGIGMPEDIDSEQPESLGLQLVSDLVAHQLKGQLELNRDEGTEFTIRFKELYPVPRISNNV